MYYSCNKGYQGDSVISYSTLTISPVLNLRLLLSCASGLWPDLPGQHRVVSRCGLVKKNRVLGHGTLSEFRWREERTHLSGLKPRLIPLEHPSSKNNVN